MSVVATAKCEASVAHKPIKLNLNAVEIAYKGEPEAWDCNLTAELPESPS